VNEDSRVLNTIIIILIIIAICLIVIAAWFVPAKVFAGFAVICCFLGWFIMAVSR
jgi:hypothetical protein